MSPNVAKPEPEKTEIYKKFSKRLHDAGAEAKIPSSCSLEIIEQCNFRCVHCYQGQNKEKRILDAKTWSHIFDEIADLGTLWILLTGGEPLLHPEFETIYRDAIEHGFIVTLFTNGSLIKDHHIELFSKLPPFVVELTLYGLSQETHDKVTQTKSKRDVVHSNIQKLREAGVPIKLKTIAMGQIHDELLEMRDLVEREWELPFKFDTKIDPDIKGNDVDEGTRLDSAVANDLEDAAVGAKTINDDMNRLRDYRKKAQEKRGNASIIETQKLYTCGAGKNGFYVDCLGRIHPCALDRLNEKNWNLNESSLRELWYEKLVPWCNQEISKPEAKCHSCDMRFECESCPATRKLATGDREGHPKEICKTTMDRHERLLKYNLCAQ